MIQPTARAEAVTLRSYNRPIGAEEKLETWGETGQRAVVDHHTKLWEDAGGKVDVAELAELKQLHDDRKGTVAGRTLWLGGTKYAYERAASQFNCTATIVANVYDLVDAAWLLLNGCGVGFKPQVGVLHGYVKPIPNVEVLWSKRDKEYRGEPKNKETLPCEANDYTWTIRVGDSAEAWAKAIGKMFAAGSRRAKKLVIDGRNVRGPGGRLRGYGWICNGFAPLGKCMLGIHNQLNRQAGQLLDEIDIMDVVNRIGEVLSSRRSAQACVLDSNSVIADQFAMAKKDYWKYNNHRRQSNNSKLFWSKPTLKELTELLRHCDECGGDPGIVNAQAWKVKCPWFELPNPCFEIALPGFCNLVNNCLPRYDRNFSALERAIGVMARANYRQTCVDLRDGVLQERWHQSNESLRLCGVSLTGIVQANWLTDYQIRRLRNAAVCGAYSQADELGLPRPKAVTTVTPAGTIAKVMGGLDVGEIAEGIHLPLGRCILNWVNFSAHDPLVDRYCAAGYKVLPNPQDDNNVLVCFPVGYGDDIPLYNRESAVSQLMRYLRWNNLWCDHNASCTISYSPEEIRELAQALYDNWDNGYIATAFMRRIDPSMTPEQVGQPYLPQEVVTPERLRSYQDSLRVVDTSGAYGYFDVDAAECSRGGCPVK